VEFAVDGASGGPLRSLDTALIQRKRSTVIEGHRYTRRVKLQLYVLGATSIVAVPGAFQPYGTQALWVCQGWICARYWIRKSYHGSQERGG